MSDRGAAGSAAVEDGLAFDEGRYLYCAVDTAGVADGALDATGVDGGTPYLVERGGVGVVVQPCSSPYESTTIETVRDWLLSHQAVIDEAGEAYGTPLPFRFDTIITGDDDAVRDWIDDAAADLAAALEAVAGQWEYRIEVVGDRETVEDRLVGEDDQLAELRDRRDAASEGRAFLLEKQYEQQVRGMAERRHRGTVGSLADAVREVATEVRPVDRTPGALDEERAGGRDELREMLAVLAPAPAEDEIGERLEAFAGRPGLEIRFTGPWPPYTFAPELGPES